MGIILVYDCSEEATFNNIANWLKQIETHASVGVAKVLVANKTDLENRVISTEQGEQLAEQHGLAFFETSAKTGSQINELFYHIARQIVKERPPPKQGGQGAGSGYASYQTSGQERAAGESGSIQLGRG